MFWLCCHLQCKIPCDYIGLATRIQIKYDKLSHFCVLSGKNLDFPSAVFNWLLFNFTILLICMNFELNNNSENRKMLQCLVVAVSHLTGQLLVLLHQFLVLLVDGQHFADTVGSSLGLKEDQNTLFTHLHFIFNTVYII